VPPASVVRLASGVVPPTTPEKVVAPVELAVNAKPPLTVPASVNAPVPLESVVAAARTAAPRAIGWFALCTVPARLVSDGLLAFPVVETPPVNVLTPPLLPRVTVPVLRKVTALVTALAAPVSATL